MNSEIFFPFHVPSKTKATFVKDNFFGSYKWNTHMIWPKPKQAFNWTFPDLKVSGFAGKLIFLLIFP